MTQFQRVDGELYIEQVSLESIAELYGTPLFVYSKAAICEAYNSFTNAFALHPHRVCYAVKANSNIAVLQVLAGLGSGFDIVSGGELQRVIAAGGDPKSVVFSGVGKQDWEIEIALAHQISCFNIESLSELHRINRVAASLGLIAPISVRVNPDVDPKTHPYIATGLKENKFGVSTEVAPVIYREAIALANVRIVGIDCHIGSQITNLAPFLQAMERVLELVTSLAAEGITLEHIDLGGGIGVRYRDEATIDLSEFAGAILQSMSGYSQTLMFEPGRVIVANAGMLLTRVVTLKENLGKHFAVVDAGMNDLIRPALYQAYQEVEKISDTQNGQSAVWDIVGPICETGDFLARERALNLSEGSLMGIHGAGAYGFVMSSNYNSRGRAAEVLIDGEHHYCIRRRESIDDLLALESLPPTS